MNLLQKIQTLLPLFFTKKSHGFIRFLLVASLTIGLASVPPTVDAKNKNGEKCTAGVGIVFPWENKNDYCESGICIEDYCRATENSPGEVCGEDADCRTRVCNTSTKKCEQASPGKGRCDSVSDCKVIGNDPNTSTCDNNQCKSSYGLPTPATSYENCTKHTDCNANEFCISNVIGKKGSSSCVPRGVGGLNSSCEDYTAQGLPVNLVCQSGICGANLQCEAETGPSSGGSNTCESEDNDDDGDGTDGTPNGGDAFRCIVGGCSGNPDGYTETYSGNHSSCTTGVCCMNRSIYAKRGTGQIPPQTAPGSNQSPGSNQTPGGSTPTSDRCADKGGIDVARGGPTGFLRSLCDSKPYNANEAKTAQPGRNYSELYACKNGDEEVFSPQNDKICDEYPWLDNRNRVPTTCKEPRSGNPIDCTANPDFECSKDFESNDYSCVRKGYRWCELFYKDGKSARGEEIIVSGSCKGAAGIAQSCGEDIQCKDFPDALCVNTQTAGIKVCQWARGVAPSPTPGASTRCSIGFMGTGCECTNTGGGCTSSHSCFPADDNPSRSYCVPHASGERWCEKSQTSVTRNTCASAPVYTTPTPTPDITAGHCPNDGNHLCVNPLSNACIAGYGPKNNAQADKACQDYTQFSGAKCYIKGATPDPTCSTQSSPIPAAGTPTKTPPPGCPINNGDGRVNSCQASCDTPYPNKKPDGDQACKDAYGTAKGACCTSN